MQEIYKTNPNKRRKLLKTTTFSVTLLVAATLLFSAVSAAVTQENTMNVNKSYITEVRSAENSAEADLDPYADPGSGSRDPGDILWSWSANPGLELRALGIEYDGTYVYVTGADGSTSPTGTNTIYRFLIDGTYVDEVAQGTDPDFWGWRDIVYDGNHMYSSNSNDIVEWSITGPAGTPTLNVHNTYVGVSPISPARALAYDPVTTHFWTQSFSTDLYEIDLTGTIYNQFDNTLSLYGLAWDDGSNDGPWLWGYGSGPTISQIDPSTGQATGVSYTGFPGSGSPGGLCYWDNGTHGYLAGLTQTSPDYAFGMELFVPPLEHDLRVESIDEPSSGDAFEELPVEVSVKNVGNNTEVNVPVRCEIHCSRWSNRDCGI
jgi:hypothetical protein